MEEAYFLKNPPPQKKGVSPKYRKKILTLYFKDLVMDCCTFNLRDECLLSKYYRYISVYPNILILTTLKK